MPADGPVWVMKFATNAPHRVAFSSSMGRRFQETHRRCWMIELGRMPGPSDILQSRSAMTHCIELEAAIGIHSRPISGVSEAGRELAHIHGTTNHSKLALQPSKREPLLERVIR